MGARWLAQRFGGMAVAAAVALPSACAGKSTSHDSENAAASGASGDVTGGSSGSSGAGGSGAANVGGAGATGEGGTGTSATGGSGGTSGGTTSCGAPEPEDRRCLVDTDCRPYPDPAACCGPARMYGVASAASCIEAPIPCDLDCAGPQWITDTMEATYDAGQIRVRCEFAEPGEPDEGLCVSHIDLEEDPPPLYCNDTPCQRSEVCVHYAPPGGPAPRCEPVSDDGTCPPGTKFTMCPSTGLMGCVEERLPPPPACVPAGSDCGNLVDCECLPQNICGGLATECRGVAGRDVSCVDLSP
jgi:hypothetical protein